MMHAITVQLHAAVAVAVADIKVALWNSSNEPASTSVMMVASWQDQTASMVLANSSAVAAIRN